MYLGTTVPRYLASIYTLIREMSLIAMNSELLIPDTHFSQFNNK